MRYILVLVSVFSLTITASAQAQWTTTGTNISNTNTGNVGIGTGTNPPTAKLHVYGGRIAQDGAIANDNNASFTNSDVTGYGLYSKGGLNSHYAFHFFNQAGTSILYGNGDGNVGIGTAIPDAKLAVKGTIHAQEVKVDLSVPGPDYVFEKGYKLPTLEEVKAFIDKNKHLPEIPSAKEMENNGVNVSEMNVLLLKKVEELTLYNIQMNDALKKMQAEIDQMKKGR